MQLTHQQASITQAAHNALDTLDAVVPGSHIHWAVEAAREALRDLKRLANTVHTRDWVSPEQQAAQDEALRKFKAVQENIRIANRDVTNVFNQLEREKAHRDELVDQARGYRAAAIAAGVGPDTLATL